MIFIRLLLIQKDLKKIIEGMDDIGFTDGTIYEVILNLVKRLN